MSAPKIIFDNGRTFQPYNIFLCNRALEIQAQMFNVTDLQCTQNLNAADEISFVVHKTMDDNRELTWDTMRNFKLAYVKELDEYFEIVFSVDDTRDDTTRTVTGTSLCEAELGQVCIYDTEINTEDDIARDDYKGPTLFYNPSEPEMSLLHRVLADKCPHYSIAHVDESLWNEQRTFTIDGSSVYDFFTGECAEQFNCLFVFDNSRTIDETHQQAYTTRQISVYDLLSVCQNDQCAYYINNDHKYYAKPDHKYYRGEFSDACPICGSTNYYYWGDDTTIYVDKENLTEGVQLQTDTDSIKNTLKITAGDDLMTSQIRYVNPTGTQYVNYFNEETLSDMPKELQQKLLQYESDVKDQEDAYRQESINYENALDNILYLTSSMMPSPVPDKDTTGDSWQVLNDIANMFSRSPVTNSVGVTTTSVTTLSQITTTMATNAVKSYSSVALQTEYYRIGYVDGSVSFPTTTARDTQGRDYRTWTGVLTVQKYADLNDIYPKKLTYNEYNALPASEKNSGKYYYVINNTIYGNPLKITVRIIANYQQYLEQRIQKVIAGYNAKSEYSDINQMLKYSLVNNDGSANGTAVTAYKAALQQYSLNRLQSFCACTQDCISVLLELGEGEPTDKRADPTGSYYLWYQNNYVARSGYITDEIARREAQISNAETTRDTAKANMQNINDELRFVEVTDASGTVLKPGYLTEEDYKLYCAYRREDNYSNSNYISDGLENKELVERANELYELAKKEVIKAGTPQHSISTTLLNLLAMDEFKPLTQYFELGNFIRIRIEEKVYRLRLISFDISFDDLSMLGVTFSDVTETATGLNDVKSILSQAKSMATSYGTVAMQVSDGVNAKRITDNFLQVGIDSALYNITNNTNEEVTIDNTGILLRSYDDFQGDYSDYQARLTHNIFCYTTDNWKSVKSAIGLFDFVDEKGIIQKGRYGVQADFMVSGFIRGSTVVAGHLYSQKFSTDAAGKLNYVTEIDLDEGNFRLADGRINYDTKTQVLGLKDVTMQWAKTGDSYFANGSVDLEDVLSKLDSYLYQTDSQIVTYNQNSDTDPSKSWGTMTEDVKVEHLGDVWYQPDTNKTFQWTRNGSTYSWVQINNAGLTQLAQSKSRIFTHVPPAHPDPPYNANDMWAQGTTGDIKHCVVSKLKGQSYAESDWVISSRYPEALANLNATYNTFKGQVQKAIGTDLGTQIADEYIISPMIGGGYLYIVAGGNDKRSVTIDPHQTLGSGGYIFRVANYQDETVIGMLANGNAVFKGELNAATGSFGKVTATGTITAESANSSVYLNGQDGSVYTTNSDGDKTVMAAGRISFYKKYDNKMNLVSKIIPAFGGSGFNLGTAFTVEEGGKFLAIGKSTESSGIWEADVLINNGMNPNGWTEALVFGNLARASGGIVFGSTNDYKIDYSGNASFLSLATTTISNSSTTADEPINITDNIRLSGRWFYLGIKNTDYYINNSAMANFFSLKIQGKSVITQESAYNAFIEKTKIGDYAVTSTDDCVKIAGSTMSGVLTISGAALNLNNSKLQMTMGGNLSGNAKFYLGAGEPSYYLQPNGDASFRALIVDYNNLQTVTESANLRTAAKSTSNHAQGQMLLVASSSKRWKYDIENVSQEDIDPHKLLDLPVRQFKYNRGYLHPLDLRYGIDVIGFIAEEIEEYYPIAVDVDEEGNAENWNERYIIPAMLSLVQELYDKVDKQQREIDELKQNVNTLLKLQGEKYE